MENVKDGPIKRYMCTGMFGKDCDLEKIRSYDTSRLVCGTYPPTYIVRAENDSTVSVKDGNDLKSALDAHHVKCVIEQAKTGEHGFGLGSETPLYGWTDRAVEFIKSTEVKI